ncbi:MAG: LysR family transcriptional regulator, partial [Pseudomonadota bacterium]
MLDNWNEVRTAYVVASLGTVSAAAESLGVHRVTVIRHIDALERALGEKLFQRHARGYTPTEAGLDLMRVAKATEEQFGHLVRRTSARTNALTGDLVVTSVLAVAPLLMPALRA